MSSTTPFGLPPIPPELKSVSPYIQRADELSSKEPIMTYWCLYYAAQLGLSLKPPSPTFLFALLNVLEARKKEIGPNDAVDVEDASMAFVENFALRVFSSADDEDRKGAGNRSTAKKFLASANFLEVLKIFPKGEIAESNEDKIRYAKWKAADIAKAYRQGRKPTPGPAGSELEDLSTQDIPTTTTRSSPKKPPSPKASPTRTSPPPHMEPADIIRANLPHTPPSRPRNLDVDDTPGSWSTMATPGTPVVQSELGELDAPTGKEKGKARGESGLRQEWETERQESGDSSPSKPGLFPPKKVVTFTQSVTNDQCSQPMVNLSPFQSSINNSTPHDPQLVDDLPQGFVPRRIHPFVQPDLPGQTISPFSLSPHLSPQGGTPLPPPVVAPVPTHPTHSHLSASPLAPPAPHVVPSREVELTPTLVAKTQKHCRFAISALDYEDAEQAKKELRAALALLGG